MPSTMPSHTDMTSGYTMSTANASIDVMTDVTSTATDYPGTLWTVGNGTYVTDGYYDGGMDSEEFMYPGYAFERPIYLFIWEILVVIMTLCNIIVIVVLMRKDRRKDMCNATNVILVAIAVTDTLTGLVTLPTYIMVFTRFVPVPDYDSSIDYEYDYTTAPNQGVNSTDDPYSYNIVVQEGYALSGKLCTWFMISKFFLSAVFHTISIYLTLLLGFQRYMGVAHPIMSMNYFSMRNIVKVCVVIVVLSPLMNIYHVFKDKAVDGMCEWKADGNWFTVQIWIMVVFQHLLPCMLLVFFTVRLAQSLRVRANTLTLGGEQGRRRTDENKRVIRVVTCVLIAFLVPELPYAVFLLVSVIKTHAQANIHLEANRATQAGYEILLVLSFHANFYIYTFLNTRFRKALKLTFLEIFGKMFPNATLPSLSREPSQMSRTTVV